MKLKPILFSTPMVNALLAGRKTQTRRLMKPQPDVLSWQYIQAMHGRSPNGVEFGNKRQWRVVGEDYPDGEEDDVWCRWVVGDELWVRETWVQPTSLDPGPVFYRADYPACVPKCFENVPPADQITWRQSIFMPRRYSRIHLRITDIRPQRLQEISVEDAIAEGVQHTGEYLDMPRMAYRVLWDSINCRQRRGGIPARDRASWATNPWVWALGLERIK